MEIQMTVAILISCLVISMFVLFAMDEKSY